MTRLLEEERPWSSSPWGSVIIWIVLRWDPGWPPRGRRSAATWPIFEGYLEFLKRFLFSLSPQSIRSGTSFSFDALHLIPLYVSILSLKTEKVSLSNPFINSHSAPAACRASADQKPGPKSEYETNSSTATPATYKPKVSPGDPAGRTALPYFCFLTVCSLTAGQPTSMWGESAQADRRGIDLWQQPLNL